MLDDLKARSVIVVADKWGVSVKTIRRIIKDKSKILAAPVGAKRVHVRDGKPTFEKRIIEWMELVRKTKAGAGVKLNINRVALTVGAQLVRSSLLEHLGQFWSSGRSGITGPRTSSVGTS